MGFSRNEVILTQLLTIDLPGSEVLRVAPTLVSRALNLTGHGAIASTEVSQRALNLYEARSELILRTHALNNGHDPACILEVRAALFREYLLTHVRMDTTIVNRWDFYQCILDLPWFENFLVISPAVDVFTHDRVLDLDFVVDYKESITKDEVKRIVRFLNGGPRG